MIIWYKHIAEMRIKIGRERVGCQQTSGANM